MQAADPLSLKFSSFLEVFHSIIEKNPDPSKVKKELADLKEMAKNTPELNARQTEAILARCDNYLSGEYGNTKVAGNFGHGKASSNGVGK